MRYLMLSLTSLFLLACGDTDNPVVPTAPAGKATVDLSAEECAAAESLPDGFLEQARAADPDIDAALLLTMWKAHGCVDWAIWGLIWLSSLEVEGDFEIEIFPPETTELETSYSHVQDDDGNPIPRIDEARIPPAPIWLLEPELRGTTLQTYFEEEWRRSQLAEAGALSTVTLTGSSRSGDKAVFTFTRTGGHLDENLRIELNVRRGGSSYTFFSGFAPNSTTYTYEVEFTATEQTITVHIIGDFNDYLVGDSGVSSKVCASVGCDPEE